MTKITPSANREYQQAIRSLAEGKDAATISGERIADSVLRDLRYKKMAEEPYDPVGQHPEGFSQTHLDYTHPDVIAAMHVLKQLPGSREGHHVATVLISNSKRVKGKAYEGLAQPVAPGYDRGDYTYTQDAEGNGRIGIKMRLRHSNRHMADTPQSEWGHFTFPIPHKAREA